MVNQLELSKKINQTFAHYPGANKLYVTDDREVFTDKVFADSHANCLPSTKIKIVERPEAEEKTDAKPDDTGTSEDTSATEDTGTSEDTVTSKEEKTTDKGKAQSKNGGSKK